MKVYLAYDIHNGEKTILGVFGSRESAEEKVCWILDHLPPHSTRPRIHYNLNFTRERVWLKEKNRWEFVIREMSVEGVRYDD